MNSSGATGNRPPDVHAKAACVLEEPRWRRSRRVLQETCFFAGKLIPRLGRGRNDEGSRYDGCRGYRGQRGAGDVADGTGCFSGRGVMLMDKSARNQKKRQGGQSENKTREPQFFPSHGHNRCSFCSWTTYPLTFSP